MPSWILNSLSDNILTKSINSNQFMKLKFIFLLFFFAFEFFTIKAQNYLADVPSKTNLKHSIGFQFNPFIDESFWHNISTLELSDFLWVSSLRYLYAAEKAPRLRLGSETYLTYSKRGVYTGYQLSIGPLIRYDLFSLQRLTFSAEFSPSLSYFNIKFRNLNEQQAGLYNDISEFRFAYYIAPVISLRSKNERWSYDFSWKFSGKKLISGKNHVPSFKINFRF